MLACICLVKILYRFFSLLLPTVTADVLVGRCVATSDFNRFESPDYLVIAPFDSVAYQSFNSVYLFIGITISSQSQATCNKRSYSRQATFQKQVLSLLLNPIHKLHGRLQLQLQLDNLWVLECCAPDQVVWDQALAGGIL